MVVYDDCGSLDVRNHPSEPPLSTPPAPAPDTLTISCRRLSVTSRRSTPAPTIRTSVGFSAELGAICSMARMSGPRAWPRRSRRPPAAGRRDERQDEATPDDGGTDAAASAHAASPGRACPSRANERGCELTEQPSRPGQWRGLCPAHDDEAPSLALRASDDGRAALLYCHAGCDYREVLQALGLPGSALSARGARSARLDASSAKREAVRAPFAGADDGRARASKTSCARKGVTPA